MDSIKGIDDKLEDFSFIFFHLSLCLNIYIFLFRTHVDKLQYLEDRSKPQIWSLKTGKRRRQNQIKSVDQALPIINGFMRCIIARKRMLGNKSKKI